jgi:hypothetical protein
MSIKEFFKKRKHDKKWKGISPAPIIKSETEKRLDSISSMGVTAEEFCESVVHSYDVGGFTIQEKIDKDGFLTSNIIEPPKPPPPRKVYP